MKKLGLLLSILVFIGFLFLIRIWNTNSETISQYIGPARYFLLPEGKLDIQGDRVNVLILGKGGEGHDAPDLTDTIIFASSSLSSKKATLISIPRDIWIDELKIKLNGVYSMGKNKSQEEGLIFVKNTVSKLVGQPIHQVVLIDFNGFVNLIDTLGGIDVKIENSFVDYKYPIAGKENDLCGGDPKFLCRYETVSFSSGIEHMDGARALKFSRSRHSLDIKEGNDLARAARQQLVINAIKNKILSTEVILSEEKINGLLSVLQNSVETTASDQEAGLVGRAFFESRDNLVNFVLPGEFLLNPPLSIRYAYQYIFLPKMGNWSKVHEWINGVLP